VDIRNNQISQGCREYRLAIHSRRDSRADFRISFYLGNLYVTQNYAIWQAAPFAQFFLNSTVVAVLSVSGQVLSTSLVAYGFARFRFPKREFLFLIVLSTLMLPPQVTVVPSFLLFKYLGWLDSFKPLVVPHWFAGSAFAIFLFRQFFMSIPKELDEAAKIDGANSLWIFFKIIVPLSTPVFITITVLAFLGSWNDFFAPLIYLNSTNNLTLPLGLAYFQRIGISGGRATEHLLMAASMAMTLPCIVLFLILQRYYVRGVTVSSGSRG
jgi:ABC-type glycerol-3-phosphate transport system permease component